MFSQYMTQQLKELRNHVYVFFFSFFLSLFLSYFLSFLLTCLVENLVKYAVLTLLLFCYHSPVPPEIPVYWRSAQRFHEGRLKVPVGALATVVRGATVRIRCAALGEPKPNITWQATRPHTLSNARVMIDGTLEIRRINFDDEGNYTCVARNAFGSTTRTTSVQVLGRFWRLKIY